MPSEVEGMERLVIIRASDRIMNEEKAFRGGGVLCLMYLGSRGMSTRCYQFVWGSVLIHSAS